MMRLSELREGAGFLVDDRLEIRVRTLVTKTIYMLLICLCTKTITQACTKLKQLHGGFPELKALTADGDVRLTCAGGDVVRAHRLILSLASPVLKDVLEAAAAARDGAAPELACAGDAAWAWAKSLALLYPVGISERRLSWEILEPLLRLADKCELCAPAAAALCRCCCRLNMCVAISFSYSLILIYRYDIKHIMLVGEEFITTNGGEICVEALPKEGAPLPNVFRLLELACDLRLTSVVKRCTKKLSEGTARMGLSMLTSEWVDGASPDAVRAALKALKLCRS
jgi:hypothetical protein